MKRPSIIMEEPDTNVETETTTTDSKVEVVFPVEEIEPKITIEDLDRRLIDVAFKLKEIEDEVRSHAEHLPVRGTSSPRRHNTYEVISDGENLVKIAKSELGSSGRYVEILALNGLTLSSVLKKGQVLELPIQ